MPRRSKIGQLPAEIKAWLDQALVQNSFSQYALLAAELNKRGCAISKTGLHRYGQDLNRDILAYRIHFASGNRITALSSSPCIPEGKTSAASPAHCAPGAAMPTAPSLISAAVGGYWAAS